MKSLLEGYYRFRAFTWPQQRKLFEELARNGQQPKALVISCVDSRVDPAVVFDTLPGEMLVVRNVANLVAPYQPDTAYHATSAALEFGVKVLDIPHIIVFGHGLCGGVRVLLQGSPEDARDFIGPWMSIAKMARAKALQCDDPEERQQCCEHEVIRIALCNLMTYPWISERVAAGKIKLYGAWLAIGTGELRVLDAAGVFVPAQDLFPEEVAGIPAART